MSLQDYKVPRDKFELRDDGTVGLTLDFPCCKCDHRYRKDDQEPCASCDHNVNAKKAEVGG